ncbi:hypothetical protein GCM10007984_34650 [Shewanella putrefaciens]|jgi:frataxin-like iron-binding protein CyaY|uniref:Uncharacterized protein n=1 Tax=Shewanella putrefaciens (strain 200) TaxID=399804 RepID=E6XHA5_SHEP2|nr:hypothetical protein SPWS13_2225 [Shewanella putrefaciens]MDR6964224.1 frataxin-like iron-binding protein CyaY [Shewanella putrefaciens]GGN29937.1 hypothetical protein GCM10007984_34650 [Shewanella putrefaciens]CAD6366753.1 hypothetical protein SHEWT2_01234 [Shewanella hafniensis]SUI70879.1 Uncharacterised protein [Shewanella putrefaciens]
MRLLCTEFSVVAVNQVVALAIQPKVLMVTHKQKPIADVWLSVHPYRMGVC